MLNEGRLWLASLVLLMLAPIDVANEWKVTGALGQSAEHDDNIGMGDHAMPAFGYHCASVLVQIGRPLSWIGFVWNFASECQLSASYSYRRQEFSNDDEGPVNNELANTSDSNS